MSAQADGDSGGGAGAVGTAPSVRLVVRTREVDGAGDLVGLLPRPGGQAWVRHGEGMVGWGQAARIDTTGPDRFAQAESQWRRVVAGADVEDEVGVRGTGLVAFGSFAFADESPSGGSLVVPSTVVGAQGGRWWVTTVHTESGVSEASEASSSARPALPPPPGDAPSDPVGVRFDEGAQTEDAWRAGVARTVRRIGSGEVDKVVLARDVLATADAPVDERAVLARLASRYPTTWTFAVDGLVGATPELLVRTEGGLVSSRVLAGTIRRTGDDGADLALAASLARSGKDLAEHRYAVRSVVDALRPVSAAVDVPETPSVLQLANVMHLATDVTGVLAGPVTSLALAAALHPSAAVGGTPTKVATQIIAETEAMDRGRYAGPVGWLDATGDGEWGIALRCGQLSPDRRRVRLFAGCGIVADSDPDAELAESRAKLAPMREALTS